MEMWALPGEDFVRQGLDDLERGLETVPALLVAVGAPRLGGLGFRLRSRSPEDPEHRLYALLARAEPDAAHSRYNALIRRLVSFERAAECGGPVDAPRLRQFMEAIGRAAKHPVRVYFTGGASLFEAIVDELGRYPAVDPPAFRRAVEESARS